MLLGLDDALPELLARGLIDPADVVDGGVRVVAVSRRHRNLRVERRSGAGYLVKQVDPGEPGGRRTLAAEARFLDFCRGEPGAAAVARFQPRLLSHRGPGAELIFELLADARPFWRALGEPGAHAPLAERLGEAVGTLHAVFHRSRLGGDRRLGGLPSAPPSIFTLHRPGPGVLPRLSPANRRLLGILHADPTFAVSLDGLADGWRVETVIHGDLRLDNLLALPSGDVRLVDWELVQAGDRAWDLAGVLHDFLGLWIRGLPGGAELTSEHRVAAAEHPLEELHPCCRAFWRGYLATADVGLDREGAVAELLRRSVRFSVLRWIQTAWELCHRAEKLTAAAVLMLQVGANVLADPERAMTELYGLEPDGLEPHGPSTSGGDSG